MDFAALARPDLRVPVSWYGVSGFLFSLGIEVSSFFGLVEWFLATGCLVCGVPSMRRGATWHIQVGDI